MKNQFQCLTQESPCEQSRGRVLWPLDCFTALAMTVELMRRLIALETAMAAEMKTVPRFEIRPLSEIEGGGYLVEFPDYPGCVADGDTPERALEEGIDALNSYRKTLEELGRPVPAAGEVYRGEWRQRVPKSLHAALARRAEKASPSTRWR